MTGVGTDISSVRRSGVAAGGVAEGRVS